MNVKFENIFVQFDTTPLYNDFSYNFEQGKVHVILGTSGCGKTTLLNVLAGIVLFKGKVSSGKISYVFQEPRLSPISVWDNVGLVLASKTNKEQRKQIIQEYLTLAEIAPKAKQRATTLSGGEQQRVALARAFAYESDVLVMDEPFKSLDLGIKRRLYDTFDNFLSKSKRTVLFVTHSVEEALALGDCVYLMSGKPVDITKVAAIETDRKHRDLYSQQMVALRKTLEESL